MLPRRSNVRIFQMTYEIHNIITRSPGQAERQQPVFLIDALGKYSPFHLETVRSAEVSVLSVKVSKLKGILSHLSSISKSCCALFKCQNCQLLSMLSLKSRPQI